MEGLKLTRRRAGGDSFERLDILHWRESDSGWGIFLLDIEMDVD